MADQRGAAMGGIGDPAGGGLPERLDVIASALAIGGPPKRSDSRFTIRDKLCVSAFHLAPQLDVRG